jgi:hypothetical protein
VTRDAPVLANDFSRSSFGAAAGLAVGELLLERGL